MSSPKKTKPLKPIKNLTETEWFKEFMFIENEVIHVVDIFNFLEEINKLGAESEAAFNAFNTVPLFWTLYRDCLQESLFIGLGRLSDAATDAINVRRILNTAMLHPEFFSQQSLRRRIKARNIPDEYIDNLVFDAWIPKEHKDWRYLHKAVNFHLTRIEVIYRPIRNNHYGHRLTHADIQTMFQKTNRKELSETLDALHELMTRLRSLFDNGNKPEIGCDFEYYNDQIKDYVRKVVRKVAGQQL